MSTFKAVQSNSALRTPHYYRQFALSLGKESPCIFSKFNPLNTDTLYGPLYIVSVLKRFDSSNSNF